MTNLEMRRLSADAADVLVDEELVDTFSKQPWNPLGDDAQTMRLVKMCYVDVIRPGLDDALWTARCFDETGEIGYQASDQDLNVAIVECVCLMQRDRTTGDDDPGAVARVLRDMGWSFRDAYLSIFGKEPRR